MFLVTAMSQKITMKAIQTSNTSNESTDSGRVLDTYDLADCVTYENWRKE